MKDIKSNKKAMAAIFVGAVCILLFLAVQNLDVIAKAIGWLSNLFLPLTVGFCLAMIIDLPMQFFERKLLKKCTKAWAAKLRKPLALVVSLAIVISVIVGITMLIIPQLSEAVRVVFSSVNELKNLIAETDGRLLEKLPFGDMLMRTDREMLIDTILEYMGGNSDYLLDTAIDTISLVVNLAIDGFVSVILAIYIIFEKKKFKKDAKRLIYAWLPEKAASWIIHAVHISVDISRNFIVGQTIEAIILGGLCGIGMFILDLPYAAAIGALVGVTALIPVVGCFVGIIVGVFMIFVVDPMKSLIFLIFLLILHQFEENVIYPKVMGKKVSLPSLWVMAAVIIGGRLAGATGMLFGVPITSIAYTLLKEATIKREEKKRLKENAEQVFE